MKELLKKGLKAYTSNVPLRGRHRMVNLLGGMLSSATEIIRINGLAIEIDHSEFWCRTVYYGIYEEPLIKFLQQNIREGDIVFDPGANMGYISAISMGLVGVQGHVYAFEPSQTCYSKLDRNNNLSSFSNLTVLHAAISNAHGEATFCDTPRVISRGYACLEEIDSPQDGTSYQIPTYGIDTFCKEREIERIRFLKLDIEGAEWLALEGSKKMLSSGRIDYILVETSIMDDNPPLAQTNARIHQLLEGNGYKANFIRPSGKLQAIDVHSLRNIRRDIIWKRG